MILKHMAEAISKQNWFVVLIELLVVVIGIFLGLQVDDWNQDRKDRGDERQYLQRLHADLLIAEKLSDRVRARRLERLQLIISAADVLFGRIEQEELTTGQCVGITASSFFNISASSLPSLDELMATGRMTIISNPELRAALFRLRQTRTALETMIATQAGSTDFVALAKLYPDLITLTAHFDSEQDEIRSSPKCNFAAMRENRAFLNDFSTNADGYDAYVRDGLAPWSTQFDRVHELLDRAIGESHASGSK